MENAISVVARVRAVHWLIYLTAYEVVKLRTSARPLAKPCQGARVLRIVVLVAEFLQELAGYETYGRTYVARFRSGGKLLGLHKLEDLRWFQGDPVRRQ